jgi:hypothetical protein
MDNGKNNVKVARCVPLCTQRATLKDLDATTNATENATTPLKALAYKVLTRNQPRNRNATKVKNTRNFDPHFDTPKLRVNCDQVAPIEHHKTDELDDRNFCSECQNLAGRFCKKQRFHPLDNIPRRCDDFESKLS